MVSPLYLSVFLMSIKRGYMVVGGGGASHGGI